MKKQRKTILIVLISLAVVLALGIGIWFAIDKKEPLSSEFTENEDDEFVVYDGKKYRYNDHLSNYLFLGIDKREVANEEKTPGTAGQADSILFISYDRVEDTIQCIAIPRDTMTAIRTFSPEGEDLGLSKDHLNIQFAFGDGKTKSCELMKEAVQSMLYGVPIQGYCAINMDGISVAVESVGEIEVVVPDDTLSGVATEFVQGKKVKITKENAELFVRYRDTSIRQSAMDRGNRQKVFAKAFAEKAKENATSDKEFVVKLYENMKPYMVTNIGNDLFAKLLQAEYEKEEMFFEIPGKKVDGADFDEYHVDENALYELVLQMFYKEVQDDSL